MKSHVGLLFAALIVFATASPAAAEKRSFKDWKTFCAQGICVAETVTRGGRVRLQFKRGAEADADWVIAFTGVQRDVAPATPVTVTVDAHPAMGFAPETGYRIGQNALILDDPALVPLLFDALRGGNAATFSFTHNQGFPIKLRFSLSGLAASVLWIDEQQDRVGAPPETATSEPATPVVPAEPVTQEEVTPAETKTAEKSSEETAPAASPVVVPAAVKKLHMADGECRDFDAEHMVSARVSDQLDEHNRLYLLPCFNGAYNSIYRAYVLDKRYPDELRQQLFVGYTDDLGWYGKDTLINADYDAKTKTLSAMEKGRGLGDCGSVPTYRWHEGFWRLLQYRNWDKCDGSRMPAEWPVIYEHPDH